MARKRKPQHSLHVRLKRRPEVEGVTLGVDGKGKLVIDTVSDGIVHAWRADVDVLRDLKDEGDFDEHSSTCDYVHGVGPCDCWEAR